MTDRDTSAAPEDILSTSAEDEYLSVPDGSAAAEQDESPEDRYYRGEEDETDKRESHIVDVEEDLISDGLADEYTQILYIGDDLLSAQDDDKVSGEVPAATEESAEILGESAETAEESAGIPEESAGTDEDFFEEAAFEEDAAADNAAEDEGSEEYSSGDGRVPVYRDANPQSGIPSVPQDAARTEQEEDPELEFIKQKIRERKIEAAKRERQAYSRFLTILSLIILAAGLFGFTVSGFFTVTFIEVEGNEHFTDEEIINIAHASPGRNLLYDPGSASIIEYLEQNPYIKSATVDRKLPSTLLITVSERKQAFAFRYDDDYLIMDDGGILLRKTRTEPKLTLVEGMIVSKIKLGEKVGTEDDALFQNVTRLIRMMNDSDLYFVRVEMLPDNAVRAYIYDNLSVAADYNVLMDNMKNGRLHRVVEKLYKDEIKRGTITFKDDGTASYEPSI